MSVGQAQGEVRARIGTSDQRVVASLEQLEFPALPAAAKGLQFFRRDMVLDGENVLEERSFGPEAAPCLYVAKRRVLIGAHRHPVGAGLLEALRNEQVRAQSNAHRDGVDKKADRGLGAVDRGMAACTGGTEQHVVLPAVPGEKHRPRNLNERTQRHAVAGREGAQSPGVFTGENAVAVAAARRVLARVRGWPRKIDPGRVFEAFEESQPEVFGKRELLPAQPFDESAKRGWLGEMAVLAAARGVVEAEEFLEYARARWRVQKCVVIRPDEVKVLVGQPQEGETQERESGEVESATAVLVEEVPEANVALFGGDP